MEELKECNLCGNTNFRFLFKSRDRMFDIEGEYKIVQCKFCGLIFLNPQPSEVELKKHYPANYYSLDGKYPRKIKKSLYRNIYTGNKISRKIYSIFLPLVRNVRVVPGGNFLDVGCGSGEMLIVMKELGMNCYGIEPSGFDESFVRKNNLNISPNKLEDANFPKEYFDCISLNFVLEHMSDPAKTFKELSRILKKGGSLTISVPQSNSISYKLFRENWLTLDTPRHLFIFSKKNMEEYSKKNFLKIKKVRYISGIGGLWGSWIYARKKNKYLSENNFFRPRFLLYLLIPLSMIINFLRIGETIEIEFAK